MSRPRVGVITSPEIPFPAPSLGLSPEGKSIVTTTATTSSRPRRSAAHTAAASIHASRSSSTPEDGEQDADEPSLTNGDTMDEDYDAATTATGASSDTDAGSTYGARGAALGDTDEQTMDEKEYSTAQYRPSPSVSASEEEEYAIQTTSKKRKSPVKKASTSRARAAKTAKTEENGLTEEAAAEEGIETNDFATSSKTPAKRGAKKGKKAAVKAEDGEDDAMNGNASDESALTSVEDLDDASSPKKKKKAATPRKRKAKAAEPDEIGEDGLPIKKARKPRKPRAPKPEPVYVIPEVTKLPNEHNYQGRLGYACLNTILRKKKPPVFCSRTCRIDTIKKNGMEFLKELGRQNMLDLAQLIQWNEDNNIRFMRLSSEMFPFAAHGEYGYSLEYAQEELKAAGDLANKYGHRITTHPGQFTQLGSPRKVVVDNAIMDLTYHCEMLTRMGIGKEGVMIIHGGGVFGDKPATIERLKKNYVERVPEDVKMRLVLENDELGYNVDDLLPICEELNIPLVLDYHHHNLHPTKEQTLEELMPRILATWERKGIKPKFHLSEPRNGAVTLMERRAHSDRCKLLPTPLPSHVDLMIEAKDKEQAVFELHRIYDLHPTIHENLRPPVEFETLHTQGRKSSKKKKAKIEDEGEEDGEMGVAAEGEEGDDAMVDMDGAELGMDGDGAATGSKGKQKAAKTPVKRGRKKKEEAAGDVPATPGPGEAADTEATPATAAKGGKKAAAPRKPRAKKEPIELNVQQADPAPVAAVQNSEMQYPVEQTEAEPVEDMKMRDIPEPIVDAYPVDSQAPTPSAA